ncbi:MAG: hypothetical protein ACI376_01175 [Candidatus Bruticola sp.]
MDSSSNSDILYSEVPKQSHSSNSDSSASKKSESFHDKNRSHQSEDDLPAPANYHLKAIPGSLSQESTQERILNAVKTISQKSENFTSDSDTDIPNAPKSQPTITLLPQKDAVSPNSNLASQSDDGKNYTADRQLNSSLGEDSGVYSHTMLTAIASPSKVFPKVGGKHILVAPTKTKKTSIFKSNSLAAAKDANQGKVLHISAKLKSVGADDPYKSEYYLSAFLSVIFIIFTFLCIATCCLTFLWPEHLARLNLNFDTASHILLAEIAVLLLSSSFQSKFSSGFRRANFLCGLLVAAEMMIVLYFS